MEREIIKINAIGSSSSGNCFIINDGTTTIMIDAGMKSDEIRLGLFKLNYRLDDIKGVLISHEHQDHIQGIHAIKGCKKYMTIGTFEESKEKYSLKEDEVVFMVNNNGFAMDESYDIGTFNVYPLPLIHDSKDPIGFIVYSKETKERLVYFTDSGVINLTAEKNEDYYIIECNYREETLKKNLENATESEKVRLERIRNNHLSSEKALQFLKDNVGSNTKKIILMHMSKSNTNPIGTMNYFRKMLDTDIVSFVHPIDHKVEIELGVNND